MRVALIGLGYWGKLLYRVITENPDYNLVAVCDLSKKRRDEILLYHPSIFSCNNYKKLDAVEFDAVVIATNIQSHFEICKYFIQKKKHIFCEKTLTGNSKDSDTLGKLIKKKQILFSGYVFLFNKGIEYMKKIIPSETGEIQYINSERRGLGPERKDVDVIFDLASHDISIINYLLNKSPVFVSAQGIALKKENFFDAAFIQLHYDRCIANIHVSWAHPVKERKMTFTGKHKMVTFDDVSNIDKIKIFEKGKKYQHDNIDFGQFQLSLRDGDIHIPKIDYVEPLKSEMEAFYNAVKNHTTVMTDYNFSIQVEKIIEAAYRSIRNNSKKIKVG